MSRKGKKRSRPVPDAGINSQKSKEKPNSNNDDDLIKALTSENKYRLNLTPTNSCEVNPIGRDRAAKNLRFLKFFMHLPNDIFFTSLNLLDRFLTRVTVQMKYLDCLTLSCFYTSAELHNFNVEPTRLIIISQINCSIRDLKRMNNIVKSKMEMDKPQPATANDFLNLFIRYILNAAERLILKQFAIRILKKKPLRTRLEIVLSDYKCATEKYSVLSLSLIRHMIDEYIEMSSPSQRDYDSIDILQMNVVIGELQTLCEISSDEIKECREKIRGVLKRYDEHCKMQNKLKLTWRCSAKTIEALRPLNNFRTNLSRITEDV